MLGAFAGSGDVMISTPLPSARVADALARGFAGSLDLGERTAAIPVPLAGDCPAGMFVVLVLGPRTLAALETPVPHTIRPVAWIPGVLP